MRAVLDTNVLVSALLAPAGTEALLLDFLKQRKYELVISLAITAELKRVLGYPRIRKLLQLSPAEMADFWSELEEFSTLVAGETIVDLCRDPDDNKFLAVALEGQADFVVSGDKDLLVLGRVDCIRIVRPADFLAILRGHSG